jgi:hypothetical protein
MLDRLAWTQAEILHGKGAGAWKVKEKRKVGNAAAELSEVDTVRLGHAHTEYVGDVPYVDVWSNMEADL